MMSKLTGTVQFLKALGNIYKAFNVHKASTDPERTSVNTSIDLLNETLDFTRDHIESGKQFLPDSITVLNGPQGTISHKTQQSIDILLSRVCQIQASLHDIQYH